ncbi:uncharacterized protein DUF4868 [Natranaerovirga hydrolytica]|uniref:Uncharacterized protein DUF4868 n=1 Tax=Natranaerovirga hydrolytica TaxID=680378 RepID=A0A4R1M9U3_9FIRM|nr:anti-phage protein KwaB [Natranaerovirga hydrolytica]TCK89126.1 uncharacterized protein DUF4868 [Natranaerovirga hydrolytica]
MILENMQQKINTILGGNYSAQIYFVLRDETYFKIKLVDIENQKTIPAIKTMFSDYLINQIVENEDLSLCELSTADERSNAIYCYDYDEYPEELGLFRNFDIKAAVRGDKFSFENDNLSKLHGYIIYLGSMEDGMVLFKKHYPISLIKRDAFLLGAIKSEKRFKKIDGDDIIRLNGSVQLMRLEDKIFVIDLKVLEQNFGFEKLIRQAADHTIQSIHEIGLIEDIQILRDAAEDISFSRKLSKVKNSSPILKLNISKEQIILFTKNTSVLSGKFKYSPDGNTIRLDTKKSKEAFLKLLNDSFLHSELTKLYYDARAKDNITESTQLEE